jgi:hypothetical protein
MEVWQMKALQGLPRIVFAIAISGCATGSMSQRSSDGAKLDLITARELSSVSAPTLYEAIVELRPSFVRRNLRFQAPTVMIDGIAASSIEVLRDLSPQDAIEVRWLRGTEATSRYGNIHTGAIIAVTLRAR